VIDAPEELKARRQWVAWKFITRENKPCKLLIDPKTGRAAKSNTPSTWGSFEEAMAMAQHGDDIEGVGYVFSKPCDIRDSKGRFLHRITIEDPYCGIDLDDAVDDDGNLKAWAQLIVNRFRSRTDLSPSGRGVKIIIRGTVRRVGEGKAKCRASNVVVDGVEIPEVEIYDRCRFFTFPDRPWPETPLTIEPRQAELDDFYALVFPPQPAIAEAEAHIIIQIPDRDDEDVIQRAICAANGRKFVDLFYNGDTSAYTSASEADAALVSLLAWYTGPRPDQLDRLYRRSAICRDKWLEREDYRERTISLALTNRKFMITGARTIAIDVSIPTTQASAK
jgi:primase-polymerase (primpol)-like protein